MGELFSSDTESSANAQDEYGGWNTEKFRSAAQKAVDNGNYDEAIKLYEALEARFPFGESSAQTQLDIAYAYFKNNDAESALAAADRFIKINPRSPGVDYAYYLKGLVNYTRDLGFIDRYLPTDKSQRDQTSLQQAYNNFEELIQRFPYSRYVPDAKQRLIAIRNNLAMHEVHVARYYLKRKAYIAAANRASGVINKYQRTSAVPYALAVMQEAYTQLGLKDLASDAQRIYRLNYPDGAPAEPKLSTASHRIWNFIGFDQ